MKIDILTLFPNMFKGPFDESILRRAQDESLVTINIHNLRKWAKDKHKTVDDRPFGGGVGMVMRVDIIERAIAKIKTPYFATSCAPPSPEWLRRPSKASEVKKASKGKQNLKQLTILLSPQGKMFNQKMAQKLAKYQHLILICGHYEGVDERVKEYIDEEISIGDYVLTGGELPAMVIIDSIVRLIPGVLKKSEATKSESFQPLTINHPRPRQGKAEGGQSSIYLEYPQYTRPENYKGLKVPTVLLSGNHKQIKEWRERKALEKTKKLRPDLLRKK